MLPKPGARAVFVFLIFLKAVDGRDQHAGFPVRAQTHIDVEQDAGAGCRCQPIDQSTRETHVDLFCILSVIFKQEDQIQIARVGELLTAQFAVSHDGKLRTLNVTSGNRLPHFFHDDFKRSIRQSRELVGQSFHRQASGHIR